MKRVLAFLFLLLPAMLHAQEDLSELSMQDLSKRVEAEVRALRAAEGRGDKIAVAHSLGNAGELYLAIARKLDEQEDNEKIEKAKKTSMDRSMDYLNKSITTAEEV